MLNARSEYAAAQSRPGLGLTRLIPSIYGVALIAILGAIAIVALAPRLDTDFWWHLKDGQYIALNHVVPSRDFMSFTMAGHAWTDHEWLAEVGIYGLFRGFGLWGPIGFFAAAIAATFYLVYLRIREHRVQPVLALFVMAATFMTSSASWGPRIQMMTLLFLSAYLLLLDRFRRTRDIRLFLFFPALMLLWANVHGGFVLGLAVLAITLVGEWLNRKTTHPEAWNARDLRFLSFALAGSVLVTVVNPNTYRQLLYPLTFVLPNAYTNLIEESASPNFHMPVMMLFELLLLALIAAALLSRQRLNWTHLFLVLAFTHLALSQVRNVAVWAVVVGPLVAVYLQAVAPAIREHFPGVSYRRRPVEGKAGPIMSVTLLLLISIAYVVEGTHFVNASTLRTAERQNFPVGAIAYMNDHRLPSRVFVSYSWGGYLLWHLFPRYRDYMDSRADTLYNDRILRGYLQAYGGKPGWNTFLRTYRIGDVLIERNAPLAQLLAENSGWRLAYRDSGAVLYTRRSAR